MDASLMLNVKLAADLAAKDAELTRLRSQLEQRDAALRSIADGVTINGDGDSVPLHGAEEARAIATAALTGQGPSLPEVVGVPRRLLERVMKNPRVPDAVRMELRALLQKGG